MSGISNSNSGLPRLLGIGALPSGPRVVAAPSSEVRLLGAPTSEAPISGPARSEFRLIEAPRTEATLSGPPRSELRIIEPPASEVTLSGPPRSEFRLISPPTSVVPLSGVAESQTVRDPAPSARPTGDHSDLGGSGLPSGLKLDDLAPTPVVPVIGLPHSAFDRLQDAVNAARNLDGSPLSASHKKAVYDFYGLASDGLTPAGADAIADQLSILLGNQKSHLGTTVKGFVYRPDNSGALVFDHLESLMRSPLHPTFESTGKPEIARQILDRLVSPEAARQGEGTLDCTLATLEGEVAFTHPADFARMAVGLATRGAATLADGSTMPLATFDPASAGGRSMIDQALQSSMGAVAAGTTHWDGQTSIGPKTSELLHEKVLGGDWATISPEQLVAFLIKMDGHPDPDPILRAMRREVDGIPKLTMRLPDGSLHSMVLFETKNISSNGIGLWDPQNGQLVYMSPLEFATGFARATVPAKWLENVAATINQDISGGEGGLFRGASRRTLA